MKTKFILFSILVSFAFSIHAQNRNEKKDIKAITRAHIQRMDSIKNSATSLLLQGVDKIDLNDSIEGKNQLKNLVEDYENYWDYQFIEEMERFKEDLGIGATDDSREWKEIFSGIIGVKKNQRTQTDTVRQQTGSTCKKRTMKWQLVLNFAYGQNFLKNPPAALTDSSAYHFWRSNYFSVNLQFKIPLDTKKRVHFTFGVDFLTHFLSPENKNYIHEVDSNNHLYLVRIDEEVTKNRLISMYYKVPLGFEFRLGKKWVLGLEGYGKFYGKSSQKLEYKTDYAQYKLKEKRYFNQNKTIWGAGAYLGHRGIKFYFGTDFDPFFKDYNSRMYNVGIIF